MLGKISGRIAGKTKRKESFMKKVNYKGRCEKRKVSKCKDVCKTYSKIQSAMVDMLENDDILLLANRHLK